MTETRADTSEINPQFNFFRGKIVKKKFPKKV